MRGRGCLIGTMPGATAHAQASKAKRTEQQDSACPCLRLRSRKRDAGVALHGMQKPDASRTQPDSATTSQRTDRPLPACTLPAQSGSRPHPRAARGRRPRTPPGLEATPSCGEAVAAAAAVAQGQRDGRAARARAMLRHATRCTSLHVLQTRPFISLCVMLRQANTRA